MPVMDEAETLCGAELDTNAQEEEEATIKVPVRDKDETPNATELDTTAHEEEVTIKVTVRDEGETDSAAGLDTMAKEEEETIKMPERDEDLTIYAAEGKGRLLKCLRGTKMRLPMLLSLTQRLTRRRKLLKCL